jgi:hypothetical protein
MDYNDIVLFREHIEKRLLIENAPKETMIRIDHAKLFGVAFIEDDRDDFKHIPPSGEVLPKLVVVNVEELAVALRKIGTTNVNTGVKREDDQSADN